MRKVHKVMTVVWLIMVPVALATGWVESIVFVSACSIYANAIGHWAALHAQQAKEE